jgi:hypothetical protein
MGGGEPRGLSLSTIAAMVASLHAHSGKTLLARLLAEHFILKGAAPLIFDTDAVERRLAACFPHEAVVLDLARVRDQMALFDTLARPSAAHRVIDVAHQAWERFFALMRDTDFVAEARAHGVQPAIFYIADRDRASREAGLLVRDRFPDCAFVAVENLFLPRPNATVRMSAAAQMLAAHPLSVAIPRLEPELAEVIEEPDRSLSALLRAPLSRSDAARDGLSFDARAALRAWLMAVLRDIHRALAHLPARVEALV